MIEIAYTGADVFGAFGPVDALVTTHHCPTGSQITAALYHAACGDTLDSFDATIVDLCMAGF